MNLHYENLDFYKIPKKVMEQAVLASLLEPVLVRRSYKKPVKSCSVGDWGTRTNVYVKVVNSNLVLMQIKDGLITVIPEYLIAESGEKKNVIEEFSQYLWNVNDKTAAITSKNDNTTIFLPRALWSVHLFGNIKQHFSRKLHVHHKVFKSYNTLETTVILPADKHYEIHQTRYLGMKSHRMSQNLDTLEKLMAFIEMIKAYQVLAQNMEY